MPIQQDASTQSVQDFRAAVAASFVSRGAVLLNLLEALAVGPRPGSPVEITASALFASDHNSLDQALRRGADALGEPITDEDWLRALRTERLEWLTAHPPPPLRDGLGGWKIRILDATNHSRPQVKTVRVASVHGADGMKPGIGLSVLAERVGEGSWTLPLEIAWMPPEQSPTRFGAEQIKAFVTAHGWPAEYVLDVDSQSTARPFLQPVVAEGVNGLGRVRNNRCFYLPVEPYGGFGRPAQLGAKFELNDPKTPLSADWKESWPRVTGGRIEARGWKDVRQKGWASQPLTLYQVIEYRADGKPRDTRPLGLLFVAGKPRLVEQLPAAAPMPRQAEAMYDERCSVEHAIRCGKQELGLGSGQFKGLAAEGREQPWVELVATVYWLRWALRAGLDEQKATWPAWWQSRKLTPGAMRRLAAGLFLGLDWSKPEVKPRGKSPGRAEGAKQEPRERFQVDRAGA